jgi:helix-turn-helix protein
MGNVREINGNKRSQFHPLEIVTIRDLEAFKTDLLLSIKALLNEAKEHRQKKWLKSYEVKKLLNISTGTLQTLRANGTIPFSKIGGIIYYDADEIDKMIEQQKRR